VFIPSTASWLRKSTLLPFRGRLPDCYSAARDRDSLLNPLGTLPVTECAGDYRVKGDMCATNAKGALHQLRHTEALRPGKYDRVEFRLRRRCGGRFLAPKMVFTRLRCSKDRLRSIVA
jgi:hypothetical protein